MSTPPHRSITDPTRRRLLGGALGLAATQLTGCITRSQLPQSCGLHPSVRLTLLGECTLPDGLEVDGMRVGGLSGLDFDPQSGQWLLISDDHDDDPPARMYRARITLDTAGPLNVDVLHAIPLQTPDGAHFAKNGADTEALRFGSDGTVLIASEGRRRSGTSPWLRAFDRDGRHVRDFSLPANLMYGRQRGPRSNQVIEGLAPMPDGRSVFASTEGPLYEDGAVPGIDREAVVRFTRLDLGRGRPTAQYAYPLSALPHSSWFGITWRLATNGVSEILALSDERLLVIERAYAVGAGFNCRMFETSIAQASDVLGVDALAQASFDPMRKVELFDFGALGIEDDNFEGMAFGPTLANGDRMLVVCSDDNFSRFQRTRLLAFAVRNL